MILWSNTPLSPILQKKSATASLCSSHKSSRNKLCGARILEIGHENVVAAANATNCLALLHNQGVGEDQIPITFHSRPSQVPPTFANAPTRTDSLQTTPNGMKMKVQRTMQPSQTVLPIAPLTQTGSTRMSNGPFAKLKTTWRSVCQPWTSLSANCVAAQTSSFLIHPKVAPSDLIKFTVDAVQHQKNKHLDSSLAASSRKCSHGENGNKMKQNSWISFMTCRCLGNPLPPSSR